MMSTSNGLPTTPVVGRSLSLDQAKARLQVSKRTIYNWIRDGKLLSVRTIGGSQRVLVESIEAVLAWQKSPKRP